MFTGLVEEIGEVLALSTSEKNARLTLRAAQLGRAARVGESIAVNGCCLTVASRSQDELTFDLLRETLERTSLSGAAPGAPVNLERALATDGRLGGHFVQGHIDHASEVLAFDAIGADYRLEIGLPVEFAHLVARKGSIAIDGISLTVADVRAASFVVWIIPHTFAVTNLRTRRTGDRVNLEYDLLAKYLERMLHIASVSRRPPSLASSGDER